MAVLGDSISAGFLVDTQLGSPVSLKSPIMALLNNIGGSFDDTMALIAGNYKANFPAAFVAKADPDCISHSCQLHIPTGQAINHAVIAHRISDLLAIQLPKLDPNADYVVVEIGANDFCANDYDQAKFLAQYSQLVKALGARAHSTRVQFIPIPAIPKVFELADSGTVSSVANLAFVELPVHCGDIRDGLMFEGSAFCPRVLAAGKNLGPLYTQLAAVNSGIQDLVEAAKNPKMTFAEGLISEPLTKDDLAIDCFHPNKAAHQKMASRTMNTL